MVSGNIYLVGLMGSGKTTVGRRLATQLGREFIDTDQTLEQRTGVTVSHIFEVEGEAGFREREARLLEEVSREENRVVSTGGGIVLDPENRKRMLDSGITVYLNASLAVLWNRLRDCKTRPLLKTDDPKATIRQLIVARDPLYRENADLVVEVSSDSASKTANHIAQWVKNNSG